MVKPKIRENEIIKATVKSVKSLRTSIEELEKTVNILTTCVNTNYNYLIHDKIVDNMIWYTDKDIKVILNQLSIYFLGEISLKSLIDEVNLNTHKNYTSIKDIIKSLNNYANKFDFKSVKLSNHYVVLQFNLFVSRLCEYINGDISIKELYIKGCV